MCLFFILFPTKETPSYHSLIHVPTRGTTSLMLTFRNYATRFNPRSHKGNDWIIISPAIKVDSFNPRSHKGNDDDLNKTDMLKPVSIHVPTRGTTIGVHGSRKRGQSFNPRSHKGNDGSKILYIATDTKFQSTFPQGERRLQGDVLFQMTGFQSTFPQGERRNGKRN